MNFVNWKIVNNINKKYSIQQRNFLKNFLPGMQKNRPSYLPAIEFFRTASMNLSPSRQNCNINDLCAKFEFDGYGYF